MSTPQKIGVIVAKLQGHKLAEIEKMSATVGFMATRATKNNIYVPYFFIVTKPSVKELERRVKLILGDQQVHYLMVYNNSTLGTTLQEVREAYRVIQENYGIQILTYLK